MSNDLLSRSERTTFGQAIRRDKERAAMHNNESINIQKPIKVTVSDPETGEVLEEKIVDNDYVIICAGRRYVKSMQIMGRTHMLAVAWDKGSQP